MRILLAHQGRADSVAAGLVEGGPWPPGTAVRILSVIEPAADVLPTFTRPLDVVQLAEQRRVQAEHAQQQLIRRLTRRGLRADALVAYGPPGSTISAEARRSRADLLVLGRQVTRGRDGPDLSVAAGLLDSAPCPVLVARHRSLTRIVLGVDGSAGSRLAERFLVSSPGLAALPTLVASIAETAPLIASRVAPGFARFDASEVAARRARHLRYASEAADRLVSAGVRAQPSVRSGDIAAELGAVAIDWRADLIIIGSDQRRALSRVILGSVAQDTLMRTDVSVLIVRQGPDRPSAEAWAPSVSDHERPARSSIPGDLGRQLDMVDGSPSSATARAR